jgi:hypothetical protein
MAYKTIQIEDTGLLSNLYILLFLILHHDIPPDENLSNIITKVDENIDKKMDVIIPANSIIINVLSDNLQNVNKNKCIAI